MWAGGGRSMRGGAVRAVGSPSLDPPPCPVPPDLAAAALGHARHGRCSALFSRPLDGGAGDELGGGRERGGHAVWLQLELIHTENGPVM